MVIVDSNYEVFELCDNVDLSNKNIEIPNILYHYCTMNSAIKIVKSKCLLLNCIKNYKNLADSERIGTSEEFQKRIFISCFTKLKNDNEMWDEFAENSTGVKFSFECGSMYGLNILDYTRKIEAYNEKGELLYSFDYQNNPLPSDNKNPNLSDQTDIVVKVDLKNIEYSKQIPDSNLYLKNESKELLNLSKVSSTVLDKYKNENETRIIAILRCTHRVELEDMSYLLLPLDFNGNKIDFETGKLTSYKDEDYFYKLWNKMRSNNN